MLVIAVDTGNRYMKTAHADPFSSGLNRHANAKPIVATDTLFLNGNYYSFSERADYHRRDKTVDEYYYILTLAAIAREIIMKRAMSEKTTVSGGWTTVSFQKAMKNAEQKGEPIKEDILLSVGLPPRDMKAQKERFAQYFMLNNGHVSFEYNGIAFDITIKKVVVSPQGFAAILPNNIYSEIIKFPQSYIIDIGGYTTDIALVANKKIDTSFFESLEFGVIHLFHEISTKVNEEKQKNIDTVLIEAALRGESIGNREIETLISSCAKEYAYKIIAALKDRQIDLSISLPVLVGGGAQILKPYLIDAIGREETIVIPDVRANAIGYEVFANRILKDLSRSSVTP